MEQHRVRSLITHLNYSELTKAKILPKQKFFTTKEVTTLGGTTPNPTLSKKLGPSQYGLFVEQIIEVLLLNKFDITSLNMLKISLPSELQKHFTIDAWKGVSKMLQEHFVILPKFQVELEGPDNIVGHPDVLSTNTVYDIKTTGRFGSMRSNSILQLLSYYCLCKLNNLPITHIGLILPLQLKIVTYNVSDWHWQPFYNKLTSVIDNKLDKEKLWDIDVYQYNLFMTLVHMFVGYHCHLKDLITNIKQQMPAIQFFVNGNVTSTVTYDKIFIKDIKTALETSVSKVFIHAPYILNMSFPGKKGNNNVKQDKKIAKRLGTELEYGGWTFYCLKKLLKFGKKAGIKGIVIHVGKTCGENYDEAVLNMYNSIIDCAQFASPECKILIESCCDQQGEVLASPEQLGCFYQNLPEHVKPVIGICIDSCHVHCAGYNCDLFMLKLEEMGVPIDLIHYNDSKGVLGCKKDRHAGIGRGYVSYLILNNVLQYGIKHNIPMVHE
jgi:endonuclease IV